MPTLNRYFQPTGGNQVQNRSVEQLQNSTSGDACGPERWFPLSGENMVSVKIFKARLYVCIRHYNRENGQIKNTRTGINLEQEEWDEFMHHLPEIKAAVSQLAPYAAIGGRRAKYCDQNTPSFLG